MPQTRIYVVIHGEKRRMIEATSASQAIRHCVEPLYSARVASAKEVAELARYGISVEQAGVDVVQTMKQQPAATAAAN